MLRVFLVAACLSAAGIAIADTLVLKDGRALHGSVVSQNESCVVFRVEGKGFSVKQTFPASEVARMDTAPQTQTASTQPQTLPTQTQIPATGPCASYYVIPVNGEIGIDREVRAELIEHMLQDAEARKVAAVVVEIDSPGGEAGETKQIVDLLAAVDWAPTMAIVHNAGGAAAVVSTACKHIYMAKRGSIGASASVTQDSSAQPEEGRRGGPQFDYDQSWKPANFETLSRDEKEFLERRHHEWLVFRSRLEAVVVSMPCARTPQDTGEMQSYWRAQGRAIAEDNGHTPLLVDGMINPGIQLSLVDSDGKKEVVQGPGGRLIKSPGQTLVLTASEAVEYGLAEAIVADCDELGQQLGTPGWTRCTGGETMLKSRDQTLVSSRQQLQTLKKDFVEVPNQIEKAPPAQDAQLFNRLLTDINQLKRLSSMCPSLRLNEKELDQLADECAKRCQDARAEGDPRQGLSSGDTRGGANAQPDQGPTRHHSGTRVQDAGRRGGGG